MQFDFDGLIQLLAGHLYSEKKVFIRELIQNAHDAIQRRAYHDPSFEAATNGRIDIHSNLMDQPSITFRDNGTGMTKEDLESYLSSIGTSGTRSDRDSNNLMEVIGQFGIGFLSGFVVASRIEVRTRHYKGKNSDGWLWKNEGRKEYTLEPCEMKSAGTEVRVFLKNVTDRGLIQDESVRDVITVYADMLKVPIHLNHSESSINRRLMPWEREYTSKEERHFEYRVYLEKTVPDSVLEVIPLEIDETTESGERLRASGLLYVTRTRRIATNIPRTIRLYQKRMFVCENTPEIFPQWATFINGVLNTADLHPNAARDNFVRDENYARMRDLVGETVIRHFEKLNEKDQDRLSNILAYHDLAIKSACDMNSNFFKKFGNLLEWRINGKSPAASKGTTKARGWRAVVETEGSPDYVWVTLPDIIESLPEPKTGGAKRLNCFTTQSSANQFFDMANAAGTTVLDASSLFESGLLQMWAKENEDKVTLVHIDREDDPEVFKPIKGSDHAVQELADEMSLAIRAVGGGGRVQVKARRFEPASLTAVLKSSEASEGREKAESILNDPNSDSDLRKMAEDMIRMSRNAEMRMSINASNTLIQRVAQLLKTVGRQDADVQELMMGIFNDAILYNQEIMTPKNAKLFHDQFSRLMERNAEFVTLQNNLEQREEEIKRKEEKLASPKKKKKERPVVFLMTPFSAGFDRSRAAVESVITELGCEFKTADKQTHHAFINDNVRAHIEDADFFVADLTDANPNVMIELGAIIYREDNPPYIAIVKVDNLEDDPDLPIDIQSTIVMKYTSEMTTEELVKRLDEQIAKTTAIQVLLEGVERKMTATALQGYIKIPLSPEVLETLVKKFPRPSVWKEASDSDIAAYLGEDADFAEVIRKRVVKSFDKDA